MAVRMQKKKAASPTMTLASGVKNARYVIGKHRAQTMRMSTMAAETNLDSLTASGTSYDRAKEVTGGGEGGGKKEGEGGVLEQQKPER